MKPDKLSTSTPKPAEITVELLQRLSFELIAKSIELWRTFRETSHGKGRKLAYAVKIHQMVIDAIKVHPDIQDLAELHKTVEEVEAEYELAKSRGLFQRTQILGRNPTTISPGPKEGPP